MRPVSPCYKTWLIEPQTGDLNWAEGRVPTPYGPISVRWEKDGNGLKLKVFVPAGTSGTVGLPASSGGASLTDRLEIEKTGHTIDYRLPFWFGSRTERPPVVVCGVTCQYPRHNILWIFCEFLLYFVLYGPKKNAITSVKSNRTILKVAPVGIEPTSPV